MQHKTERGKYTFEPLHVFIVGVEPTDEQELKAVTGQYFSEREDEAAKELREVERDRDVWRLRAAALFFVAMAEVVFILAGWR